MTARLKRRRLPTHLVPTLIERRYSFLPPETGETERRIARLMKIRAAFEETVRGQQATLREMRLECGERGQRFRLGIDERFFGFSFARHAQIN